MKEGRIHFIVELRAIAVLIVMFSHLWQTFHFSPDLIEDFFYIIPLPPLHFAPFWVEVFTTPPNIGQIGVGIFFLISGFIIPVSLERHGSLKFLGHRFFRLYPAYLVCVLLWLVPALAYWHLTPMDGGNYSLLQVLFAPFGVRRSDYSLLSGILWTLIIEWQFYLISALIFAAAYVRQWKLQHVLPFHLIILMAVFMILRLDARFSLLLMGLSCFLYYKKRLNLAVFLLFNLGLFAFLCAVLEPWRGVEYFIAVCIWYFYFFRRFSAPACAATAFIARLSYPLYLLHTMCYFGVSYFVNFLGAPMFFAYIFWLLCVFALSFAVTKYIEEPGVLLGKKLIK